MPGPNDELENSIRDLGERLFAAASKSKPGLFDAKAWQAKLLEWAMQDPSFKVDLFRFVDVLPSLKSSEQVARHIEEYLLVQGRKLPMAVGAALKTATVGVTSGIAASVIRKNVTSMAERFIAGSTLEEAARNLDGLRKERCAHTIDLLGEKVVSEKEAEHYLAAYKTAVEVLGRHVQKWADDPLLDRNHVGVLPKANVSIKLSALYSQSKAEALDETVVVLVKRVMPILRLAKASNVFVNFDLEHWDDHEITYRVFEEVAGCPELRDWPHLGIVAQAYLKSAEQDIARLLRLAKDRGQPITVRLVKGAYWDYETVLATQRGWPKPVFQHKVSTDANYEKLSRLLLENHQWLWPAFGSHNMRSLSHAIALAKALNVPDKLIEIQMLYGMAEPEREAVQALGERVRLYCPVGELLPGMAYLVRRLLENTANQSFLRLAHHEEQNSANLLVRPEFHEEDLSDAASEENESFRNTPLLDFALLESRQGFQNSIRALVEGAPLEVPIVVSGKASKSEQIVPRQCPSDVARTVARVSYAQKPHVEQALQEAKAAWPAWRLRSLEERAAFLEQLADVMLAKRYHLAALMAYETAKPWKEADADLAEAVDFCRYYALQARHELAPRQQGSLPGEDNILLAEGRGVAAIIAPWNFPLAILCGMTTAALVAGNTVIMKPAEQSSAVAYRFFECLIEAGIPKEVVHFLPGQGELVGQMLVEHPDVATIAFTGSKNVGLSILKTAGTTVSGQTVLKRVICEMGGKNAIIVDDDADLDEAVEGVVYSALGYAGQKCSACSRILVTNEVYDVFVARLVAAMESETVGSSLDPKTLVGPVIDEEAQKRLLDWIERGQRELHPLYIGQAPSNGYYVPPALFEVSDAEHPMLHEELFGPVVALFRCRDFAHALEIGNSTEFALTGGVFSRTPSHIDTARRAFQVGNLYINRAITGAYVNRQPFGGFKMSGAGTKAGGPHYVLHFADFRVITENTMRRGFVPDENLDV